MKNEGAFSSIWIELFSSFLPSLISSNIYYFLINESGKNIFFPLCIVYLRINLLNEDKTDI